MEEVEEWKKVLLIDQRNISERGLIAELIRYAFLSTSENSEANTTSINKILSYVRPRIQFQTPEIDSEKIEIAKSRTRELNLIIRDVLDDLDMIGDISELSNGVWKKTPSRFIKLGSGIAVLSSLPTAYLESMTGVKFSTRAFLRTADESCLDQLSSAGVAEQKIERWIGKPIADPSSVIKELEALEKLALPAEISEPFDVYAPWENQNRKQNFRWVTHSELKTIPSGLQICRASLRRSGGMRVWLGKLEKVNSEVRCVSEFPITSVFASNIQLALDKNFGAENYCSIVNVEDQIALTMNFRVPFETFRFLNALSTEISINSNWSRTYYIQNWASNEVIERLKVLDIKLSEG